MMKNFGSGGIRTSDAISSRDFSILTHVFAICSLVHLHFNLLFYLTLNWRFSFNLWVLWNKNCFAKLLFETLRTSKEALFYANLVQMLTWSFSEDSLAREHVLDKILVLLPGSLSSYLSIFLARFLFHHKIKKGKTSKVKQKLNWGIENSHCCYQTCPLTLKQGLSLKLAEDF